VEIFKNCSTRLNSNEHNYEFYYKFQKAIEGKLNNYK